MAFTKRQSVEGLPLVQSVIVTFISGWGSKLTCASMLQGSGATETERESRSVGVPTWSMFLSKLGIGNEIRVGKK